MDKNEISGIYCIENLINNKKYIGQTKNLSRRKYTHFLNLNNGVHPSKHLQSAFNKYGKNNFVFKILIYCESFELTRYEQFFVDITPLALLYNKCLECVNNRKGILVSEETRKKLSFALRGRMLSEETKRKFSEIRRKEKILFMENIIQKKQEKKYLKQIVEKIILILEN